MIQKKNSSKPLFWPWTKIPNLHIQFSPIFFFRLTPILKETSTINKIKEDQVLLGAASFITALKIINVENSIVLRLVKFISEESPNTIYDIVTLSEAIKAVSLNE